MRRGIAGILAVLLFAVLACTACTFAWANASLRPSADLLKDYWLPNPLLNSHWDRVCEADGVTTEDDVWYAGALGSEEWYNSALTGTWQTYTKRDIVVRFRFDRAVRYPLGSPSTLTILVTGGTGEQYPLSTTLTCGDSTPGGWRTYTYSESNVNKWTTDPSGKTIKMSAVLGKAGDEIHVDEIRVVFHN
jgi:hypothetical protein